MYALQQAMRAIRGNWVASVATITTMTLSLTILAGFSLLSLNLNQVLANLQSELEVSAFLAPGSDGLFSAVITLGLAVPGYQFVIARLAEELPFVPFVRDPALVGQVALLLTALALLVGLVGSAISVSQHLQERD